MKQIHIYASVVATALICSAAQASDDYEVVIQKDQDIITEPVYYAFRKTNVTGSIVYPDPEAKSHVVYGTLKDPSKSVDLAQFPALRRNKGLSKRVSEYTQLFASTDEEVLLKKLNGETLNDKEKNDIASARVPHKVGTYCTGTLFFIVERQKPSKPASKRIKGFFSKPSEQERLDEKVGQLTGPLVIKVTDQRNCMRAGSKTARLSRGAERSRREQQDFDRAIQESLLHGEREKAERAERARQESEDLSQAQAESADEALAAERAKVKNLAAELADAEGRMRTSQALVQQLETELANLSFEARTRLAEMSSLSMEERRQAAEKEAFIKGQMTLIEQELQGAKEDLKNNRAAWEAAKEKLAATERQLELEKGKREAMHRQLIEERNKRVLTIIKERTQETLGLGAD